MPLLLALTLILMNYTDENGVFTGFDTELATLTCEKLGLKPEFVENDWKTKEVELNAKSIDCIWNGLTIDDDRKAAMEITKPYIMNAQVVLIKEGTADSAVFLLFETRRMNYDGITEEII